MCIVMYTNHFCVEDKKLIVLFIECFCIFYLQKFDLQQTFFNWCLNNGLLNIKVKNNGNILRVRIH